MSDPKWVKHRIVDTFDYQEAAQLAAQEAWKVRETHGDEEFKTLHGAAGVIREEHDELWDEIRKKAPTREDVRKEAIQLAAMCLRLIAELT